MHSLPLNKAVSERELLDRLKNRDTVAMRTVYDVYGGYLFGICSRYIPDDEDVKDVIQEAFIKIFKNIDRFSFRGEGSLRAWMSRIVINDSLQSLRKRRTESLDALYPEVEAEEEDTDPGFSDVPVDVILRMIRSLPEGYRKVFNLYVFENMSHKEIAKLLGIKENSSCSQYSRARSILSKQIMDYKKNKI